jgi:tetratricopeptide (TPR) repeat protein
VVGIGDNVRLVSNVYDLDTREEVAQGQSEGRTEDVLRLVDDLAVGTVRSLLENTGREGAGDLTAETLTTESLDALREFLEGERHYRKGDFAEAVQSFERAVAADTSFAIGLVRLSEAYGWLEAVNSEKMKEYGDRAVAHTENLPPRYQFIMSAWDALNRGSGEGLPVLRQAVQKYPDDPEAWFLLAETLIHVPAATYATLDEIEKALDRAVALDPNFAPYWVHVADLGIWKGDRGAAEAAVARYVELAGNDRGVKSHEIAIPLVFGDSAEAEGALQAAREAHVHDLDVLLGTYNGFTDRFDRLARLDEIFGDLRGSNQTGSIAWRLVSAGALSEAAEWAASPDMSPANLGIYFGHQFSQWEMPPVPELAKRAEPSLCDDPYNTTCHILLAPLLAGTGRWDDLAASVRSVRAAARERAAQGDSATAATRNAYADVMEALGTLRRGEMDAARRVFERYKDSGGFARGQVEESLAEMDLAQGRWDQAIHHAQYNVFGYSRPSSLYVQAKAYEGKGDTEKAREAWGHLVSITRESDADIPRVREAREALARLGG